ncbi:MAG: Fe-S cluster assembly protein SufD [Paraburkholderia sp.]|uniref:Fe-S cluster assembly protein SufD n=1 Tax=Paraburkholderia sp. TaxID=1926495 RepID=UPI0012255FD6|nr:Fe-S cluster assembly protein SufD [Paraburkholderia sp.]TAM05741.1 MAG: Fe-S cluster assembly protein SufD [Paraburkholderia sp.]
MNTDARSHYLADFARVADLLPGRGVPWLGRLRKDALDQFAQRGFPTRKDEDWKYTSVAALERQHFHVATDCRANAGADRLMNHYGLAADVGHLLVFVDGRFAPWLSDIGALPAGALLSSLADTLEAAPDVIESYLANNEHQTVFGALNTAFMADGAFLHLRRGIVLEAPVHLLFLSTRPDVAHHMRNLIVAEDGAQVTVIEHYAGIDDMAYFNNVVTSIFAEGNAAIAHHKLQQEGSAAFHVAGIHAAQQRDSRLESHSISFGAALARNDITIVLHGNGGEAMLNGLYLVGGTQHVDHHTRIDHCQPNSTSREHYRGVLEGQSHAVFNGKVIVQPGAQKTNAFQTNHNLLLSREAEVDTKPELQIYADDVKCNHGATVGKLDEAQLFYLRSRGIDEAVAHSLLVHAFAHDVIERIRVASLRTRVERILLARLPQEERIEEL